VIFIRDRMDLISLIRVGNVILGKNLMMGAISIARYRAIGLFFEGHIAFGIILPQGCISSILN